MEPETATMKSIPPIPTSSSAKSEGAGSCSISTAASKNLPWLWKGCANLAERDRIDIKQQAVLDGLRLGEKLSCILRNHKDGSNQILGAEELGDWTEQFDNVKELYEAPHSTVGFIGATGAGKSTLLNALLGEQDLLPSSNEKAATATACRVVYNHGPDGYRAHVSFRNRQGFTDKLDEFFQNLQKKQELQARMEGDPDADEKQEIPDADEEQEIEEQLECIELSTAETLETLGVLLGGAKEEDLRKFASAEEFFKAHPLEVLGTTEKIIETDRETFLARTRSFMDSTTGICDGQERMLWPLIEHVTIFVKSEILKYGLELVDLPGLGDAVESRSRVAEDFSNSLDITAIVSPAIRVTDEKTVAEFIKGRQQNERRMNGRFDRDSICVVVSKSEDMDLNVGLSSRCKDYPNIEAHLARYKALDKSLRTAGLGLDGPEPETLTYHTSTATENDDVVRRDRREHKALRESLRQAAIFIRNQRLSELIQKNFWARKGATKSNKDDQCYVDTVEVFPTCARAFQAFRHLGGESEVGFPTEQHTGIPRLQQWLFEATFKKREKHLDAILNKLSSLLVKVQTWISLNEDATGIPTIGAHEIDSIHERHHRSLTALLRQSGEELRRIEPLKAKGVAIAACQREYPSRIDRWRFRYPNDTTSHLKIFANVQNCILRKNGGYHQSKGRYSYEYQWVDELATVFIDEVVNDWKHTFLELIPGYEAKIYDSLEHAWQCYTTALNNFCSEHNVPLRRYAGKVQRAIDTAKADLAYGAHLILASFRVSAQHVHPLFRKEIQRIMTPVFEETYAIRGLGCMRKREELLKQFATNHSADMPVKACEAMEAALAELTQKHVKELEGLATDAVSTVKMQMKLLLGITSASSSEAARKNQKILAKEVDPHLNSWKFCWQKPSSQMKDHVMRGDLSIPEPELIKVKHDEDGVQAAVSGGDTDHSV